MLWGLPSGIWNILQWCLSCLFSSALSPDICGHSKISQDYISPTEEGGLALAGTQLWRWETVFLQHSFLSSLGNGLPPAFHNNTALHLFRIYKNVFLWFQKLCFSDYEHCTVPHLCCIFKISSQQLINCVIRVEHLRKEFHIPKHLLPTLLKSFIIFPHTSFTLFSSPVFPLTIRSWVSQVCLVGFGLGLKPMFIFARHSYIRPPPHLPMYIHYCNRGCNRGCAGYICSEVQPIQCLTICARVNMLKRAQM